MLRVGTAAPDSDESRPESRRGTMTAEQWNRGRSELQKKTQEAHGRYELAAARAAIKKAEVDKAEAEERIYVSLNPYNVVVKKP